ncbi:phosphoenolpyruvate phosphomutase [Streptomyces dioscori]|uniref:Phosphoenolpyruvate phosphomutase n=1 Tax=Streptomyces dioscori TaxID=2109333 RepID=A0A2P8Q3N1_9ACTN|nr:isocitrate lyase/phosphoenolpyruvate mutase family protein [Streptomyces dioscori]PSM40857.1 phosphoenolpyruvate phosphomutase [Streptomyces dioscori]
MEKARHLRHLLASGRLIRAAGAHDGLGAVLVEEAGFDAVWASSFEVSAARALPDASLLTMTEYLQAAVHLDRVCSLPVIADCDTGFGNALNVAHMVTEYEAAGIAGVCMEDKTFPKVNSFAARGQDLADTAEFAHKVRVARNTARGDDFLVIARTEAFIAGFGVETVLERAHAYVDAGADAILVHSKGTAPDQILAFLKKWRSPVPVVAVPTTYSSWHACDAHAAGVSMLIYANHGLRAKVAATRHVLEAISAHGSSAGIEPDITSMKEIFALQRLDEWIALNP